MPIFAKATMGDRSTGSKQTLNGLFYVITPNPLWRTQGVLNVRALFSGHIAWIES